MNRRQRIIKKLVTWMVALIYHRVEVRQSPELTASGAELANSSHFGGFTDPLLLAYAMDRVPRFIARDVIWKIPPARWVMNWVGAIPIHKPEDTGERTSNDQMFASTYRALGEGDLVTIFPEGITVDDPQIAAIKTGSARIALGAQANGVPGITLISAGIHYDNKAALRSDVFIDIGWPVDLDSWVADHVESDSPVGASDHAAVRALTATMERNLRSAAPDFDDWTSARALSSAAQVALRPPDGSDLEVGLGDRERLATLVETSGRGEDVVDAMDVYQSDLDAMGFTDEMFVEGLGNVSSFSWYIFRTAFVGLLLLPFAAFGLIINVIPMLIVWLIGRLKVADAMMSTLKPIGALLAFSITWAIWIWFGWTKGSTELAAAMALLMPVYLFGLIAWFERLVLFFRAIRGFAKSRSVKDVYAQIHVHRADVVEAVAQSI